MSHKLRILLLVVLSAPFCRAFQAARFAQIQEIHPTAESKAAQDQAFNARKRLLVAAETAQQLKIAASNSNTPADQAKAAAAQQQVAEAQKDAEVADKKAKDVQSAAIAPQDWNKIQTALQTKSGDYESKMKSNSGLATTLVLAGLILAALSALAGFLKKSIAAGVLSIVVTTVVGIPKLFPITQRAEYYRALFVQSSSLLLQAQLRLNPTLADYNEFAHDIQVLAEYETNKFPSGGDVAQNTQDLIKEIAASSGTVR
jgi:hypothetical protein